MNIIDRNRLNELKANRATLMQETLKMRARQISLDHERAILAVRIAENDQSSNSMDQEIAEIVSREYHSRLPVVPL